MVEGWEMSEIVSVICAIGLATGVGVLSSKYILEDEPIQISCAKFSPDGERLAYATYTHDAGVRCTYIPDTRGSAKRTIP